jgi:hypothetical protein
MNSSELSREAKILLGHIATAGDWTFWPFLRPNPMLSAAQELVDAGLVETYVADRARITERGRRWWSEIRASGL